jgi:hypothetical protein
LVRRKSPGKEDHQSSDDAEKGDKRQPERPPPQAEHDRQDEIRQQGADEDEAE